MTLATGSPTLLLEDGFVHMKVRKGLTFRLVTTVYQPGLTYTAGAVMLAQASIPVTSTAGFPSAGSIMVGTQLVAYTSIDATHFLGCTGGSGVIALGSGVVNMTPVDLTNFTSVFSTDAQQPFILDTGTHAGVTLGGAAGTISLLASVATIAALPIGANKYTLLATAAGGDTSLIMEGSFSVVAA